MSKKGQKRAVGHKEFWLWVRAYEANIEELRLMVRVPSLADLGNSMRWYDAGARNGFSDWLLPVKRGDCCGLWIEIGQSAGREGKIFSTVKKELEEQGYEVFVSTGWLTARDRVIDYLGYSERYKIG